ncbi:MAG: RES domain-containing protein [Actinomycetia bacterium]|nr:RES domain-containing protein [Actinomycetes bacterium]
MADNLIDFKDGLKNISPSSLKKIYFHGFEKGIPALNTENYKYANGRWHIKGEFGGLYLGENQKLCREEIRRVYAGKTPAKEYRLVELQISLSKVLDLTDPGNLIKLNIEKEQLISGKGQVPKTVIIPNSIAKSAHESGYEAIIVPSATGLGKAIVLYEDNFKNNSYVKILSNKKLF